MDGTLWEQGLNLMLYGMGTVFVFLTVLVLMTQLMSRTILQYFPDKEEAFSPAPVTTPTQHAAAEVDPHLLAVIKAAIDKHRSRQK